MKEELEKLGFKLSASGYNSIITSKAYSEFKLTIKLSKNKIAEAMVEDISGSGATVWYYVTLMRNPTMDFIQKFDALFI